MKPTIAAEMESSNKPHALFISFPVMSHANPMLNFSKTLTSKGVKVTLATPSSIFNSVKTDDTGITVVPYDDGAEMGFIQVGGAEAYMEMFREVGMKSIAKLVRTLQDSETPVQCVAYSSLFPTVLDVTKEFGLVAAAFFITSCSTNVIHYHVYMGLLDLPVQGLTFSLPGLPVLEVHDLPTTITGIDSSISRQFLDMCLGQYPNLDKADWLLFNSSDAMENEEASWLSNQWPNKMMTIGPCVPSICFNDNQQTTTKPASIPSIEWLNTKEPNSVIYVSFGTVVRLTEEQRKEVAFGLKNSNCNFLWSLGAADESELPIKFKEETADRGLIVPWCPQLEVLAHKAVGCIFTHCGWNSVLEAMSLGMPMIAMPQFFDHIIGAKYVADVWRVGVRLLKGERGLATREEIESCIGDVMAGKRGDEIRRNAVKWRALLKEGGRSRSDRNADRFIASLGCTY